jgi:hypothetical protein
MVCSFLLFRFNPLREKNHLREIDSRIIFSSSLFLLLNMGVIEIIKKIMPNYLSKYSKKINDVKVIV